MNLLIIQIPLFSQEEIKFTIQCLIGEFLGLEYKLQISNVDDIIIQCGRQSFRIKNHFFSGGEIGDFKLPSKVSKGAIEVNNATYQICSIYGSVEYFQSPSGDILNADLISSTFFMLSRWEEYVKRTRDEHGRFPATASLAYSKGFLDRPIVNEYVELLWVLIQKIGVKQPRKKYEYKVVPTHDVDLPYMWYSTSHKIKSFAGKIKAGRFLEFGNNVKFLLKGKDPWDTHEFLMDEAEKIESKANFFFMTGGTTKYENKYSISNPRIVKLINAIKERGHNIGLHPSYDSYNNLELLKEEKLKLEQVAEIEIISGRQHYLRFETPTTWRLWNEIGMKWDSTMSYADCSGFRCGVCYPFPVFDLEKREILDLYERPLISMEASLLSYEKLSVNSSIEKVRRLQDQVKKYNGEFIFLWHNSSFNIEGYMDSEPLLESMYLYT